MEKGLNKHWTHEHEVLHQKLLEGATSFAERYMLTMVCNVMKYDGRSRAAKKATARLQLTLATASDDDLLAVAKLWHEIDGYPTHPTADERLKELTELRGKVRAKGIKRDLVARGD